MVQADVNISHGSIEKLGVVFSSEGPNDSILHLSKMVYMDNRIEAKLYSQKALLNTLPSYKGFDCKSGIKRKGLDLRYGANMNISLGFDKQAPCSFIKSLKEFQYHVKA